MRIGCLAYPHCMITLYRMTDKKAIVLIHGIWMNSLEMLYLHQYFQKQGYNVYGFNYPSVRKSPAENARRLKKYIDNLAEQEVHLVAHSLGGVVVLHMFDLFDDIKPGRVVLMGCPYRGSDTAKNLAMTYRQQPLIQKALLGRAQEGALLNDAPPWRAQRELGVLAGNQPFGMGTTLRAISDGAHDGTVHVKETVIDNAHDFTILPVSHTSMLFTPQSAQAVSHFLAQGHFPES